MFPISDKAEDVLEVFKKKLKEQNVTVKYNCKVSKIMVEQGMVKGVQLENGEIIEAEKIILTTGGKSYPVTGSTGDGYKIAQELGHNIINLKPALVPLRCNGESLELCKNLQGLSLKNVKLTIKDGNKTIYDDFGEMLFTHLGISGPIVLSSSSILLRYKNIDKLLLEGKIKATIDLKPALTPEKLELRVIRDFDEMKNKEFKNSLNKLLPQKMINPFIKLTKIDEEKKVNTITKEERKKIVYLLKHLEFTLSNFGSMEEAIVTSGGVDTKEINPKTMESKIIKGLYFAGEIIDVDALTGGFNLQIAFSTGRAAGLN